MSRRAFSTTRSESSTDRGPRQSAFPKVSLADRAVARAVERWFDRAARELPWRTRRNGYTALVSEAMLQQTQVSRVVEKYAAFMQRFPTIERLAAGSEQEVLAHWQGLGYYGRARRLHAAAQAIVERFAGEVPRDASSLASLPGVGRYTAGAIASIAFGERTPIVDTNVARVLMRLDGQRGSAQNRAMVAWAWERAASLVAASRDPAAFNEGLMELGALVCPAGEPKCGSCPLAKFCAVRASGDPASIPDAKPAPRRQRIYHHTVVVARGDSILLEQRPPHGLWASMWQAPTIEGNAPIGAARLAADLGMELVGLELRERFEHRTSHREVVFIVHAGRTRSRRDPAPRRWVQRSALGEFPLANPMRRIIQMGNRGEDERTTGRRDLA